MFRGWTIVLLATLTSTSACMNAGAPEDDHGDYDVVVTDSGLDDADDDLDAPPTLGSPPTPGMPPGQELPAEEAVGWVSVIASDGESYEVLQNGSVRGLSTVELTQRPGSGEYALRNDRGQIMCRGSIEVKQYESVCLECDVQTGKFHKEPC
ncbi:MAG TPA: hypothetical protein VIE68_09045 [Gemmatimonadota bacterium]|jgi:hypothetical protein